ncbi:MAG: molybdopterin molybdotransferase MoeA [Firmicutes bacterium]|nr:molybdopterin molybdotransferase MoeA [Bacillota bacterium]
MLNVKTPEEVMEIINREFAPLLLSETVDISDALGRVLSEDVKSNEYVPGFNRSSVDGYAIRAKDSFGCTESIPAILKLAAEVEMGKEFTDELPKNCCVYVPTGGKVPDGADGVVMIEYTEKFSGDEVAIIKPIAPGENLVYKGDDCKPGQSVAKAGIKIKPQHIGVFASLGIRSVQVAKKITAGIISTGDELVRIEETPGDGQVRDVNSYMLAALCKENGCEVINYGFCRDDEQILRSLVKKAVSECDLVLISGGSSVGQKDATARIIEEYGPLLLHGIAMKPGKPTIFGRCGSKAIIGLPGHPGASFFVSTIFVRPLIARLTGMTGEDLAVTAKIKEAIPANQGRTVYIGVKFGYEDGSLVATPVQSKSGLVSSLANSDAFVCVPRDCEGYAKGTEVKAYIF